MKELYRRLIRGQELTLDEAKLIGDTSEIRLKYPIKYCVKGNQYLGSEYYNNEDVKRIAPIITTKMNLVAKFIGFYSANQEIEKFKKTIGKNVPIINTYGIANIYNLAERKFLSGLVLERVYGETVSALEESNSIHFPRAKKMWKRRIKQTQRKKICILDPHNQNVMLDLQTQKIVLIDPAKWIF